MQIPPASPRAGLSGGFIVGALRQLVNELGARVGVPLGTLVSGAPPGDLLEPRGDEQRAGADAIERLVDGIVGRRDVDPQAARTQRPLLATATVTARDGATSQLTFEATASGADWGVAGRESAMVAVYVDGRYVSSVVVLGERDGTYRVNLGGLPAGTHTVELRAAIDAAPLTAAVRNVSSQQAIGEQALIDRLAPVVELRDDDSGPGSSIARGDTPLMLLPAITRYPDGSRLIEYRLIWSNEEGGTPGTSLMAKYGRTVDAEPLYRVAIDAQGNVLKATYQSPLHQWVPFDGSHDATGRPLLRVSTANNLISTRTGSGGRPRERWSEVATGSIDGASTEFETMRVNPWIWTVMAKELIREGKVRGSAGSEARRGAELVADPRRYVFLGPLDDAARAAIRLRGGLELIMANGRRVLATFARNAGAGNGQTAVELPQGAVADAIRGVATLGVQAIVLDERLVARELPQAA